jgi:hypothetical protein
VSVTVLEDRPLGVRVDEAQEIPINMGQPGPPGPRGPAGENQAFIFDQPVPSDAWVIVHNFGRLVSFSVFDAAGNYHPFVPATAADLNTLILSPNPPLAGKAVVQ